MPFFGAELRSEAMEAPPMLSAKNTWAMATGLSEGQCVLSLLPLLLLLLWKM